MSLECETCGGTPYEGHAPGCTRANRSKARKAADMQPAPATEQASFEIWAAPERYDLTRCGESSRIGQPDDYKNTATAHAWEVWRARATQAERVQDRPLAMSNAEAAQWARANGLNVPPEWEGLAERVQSSESIGKDKEFLRLLVAHQYAEQASQDDGSDVKRALVDDTWEAFIGYIDARRATASKAEADPVRKPVAWKYRALAGKGEWRVTLSEDWARSVNGTIDVIPLYDDGIAATTKQGTP